MNKGLQTVLIVVAVLVGVIVLVGAGFFFGRSSWGWTNGIMGMFYRNNPLPQTGYGMMDGYDSYGMMGSYDGYGMMGGRGSYGMTGGYDTYCQDGGRGGYGMMGGRNVPCDFDQMPAGPGTMGPGMMGRYAGVTTSEPLSVQDSLDAVEAYLADLGNDDLEVEEIMVFEYNSYAIVKETSTGIGAFELLVDPDSGAVFPEYGPNMMWNLKYGMHAGNQYGPGMMGGGMMGAYGFDFGADPADISAEMTISADEAFALAQEYLDVHEPGVTVSDEITAFYGYYTIDLEQDGALVGMLSVNGFTGSVFPHTWHGTFIEMTEFD